MGAARAAWAYGLRVEVDPLRDELVDRLAQQQRRDDAAAVRLDGVAQALDALGEVGDVLVAVRL